jgi:hypothetical protein
MDHDGIDMHKGASRWTWEQTTPSVRVAFRQDRSR